MSIEIHELSVNEYRTLRYEIIANVEGEKNYAYIDSKGYVTIGAGFNLYGSGVRELVLSDIFSIDREENFETYQQLVDIFSQQYQVDARGNPLPGETERLNNALNAVMETWAQGGDDRPSTFVIEDAGGQTWQQRVRAFFENNFSQQYEDKVTDFIQNHPVMLENVTALVLPNSKERAALFSLAYRIRRTCTNQNYSSKLNRAQHEGLKIFKSGQNCLLNDEKRGPLVRYCQIAGMRRW
ncbi:hypothetical protein [Teredinibacter turnerae]|uniref:hypothetical protein n=1 Tax=Teredinibacter turnerae TaxID=2426 RepID=UPI00036A917D|nr:hypothetical protein [Teredinibacter turnerae]